MNNRDKEDKTEWPVIFYIVAVFAGFAIGGPVLGIVVLIVGIVMLGWSKRHEGPFPTNRPKE